MSTPKDYPVLDIIAKRLAPGPSTPSVKHVQRLSECVEFYDGQWFEIVVRRIDAPS
jgi:hypothetical protein